MCFKLNQIQTWGQFKTGNKHKAYKTQRFIQIRLYHRDYAQFLANDQVLLTSQSYKHLSLSLLSLQLKLYTKLETIQYSLS